MTIKAIETRYNGYRFRSRLEARWAVFFTEAGVSFEYEPEGFDLGAQGKYLPDFYLPDLNIWMEIKPNRGQKTESETLKMAAVVQQTGANGIIAMGEPFECISDEIYDIPGVGTWDAWAIIRNGPYGAGPNDCPYVFCVCPHCGKVGIEFDGRGSRVCGAAHDSGEPTWDGWPGYGNIGHGDKGYSSNHPKLRVAAAIARAARFEHGEVPA